MSTATTPPLAPVICVFGTGSDVGKSWIATGLCRIFSKAGYRVAPYKAQNMSNNAGVTKNGLEMGRAQIIQAQAAGISPHVDMNPLLLKPNTDTGAQIVALGRVVGTMEAAEYFKGGMEPRRALVLDALDRLRATVDLVIAEGAGSCAEVNLRGRDLVNMPVAHHANAKVILVADINKGGVFAQVVGTLDVMPLEDRARVCAVVINRFRGDAALFEDGRLWIEERTGLPVIGVVPWAHHIQIEEEDGFRQGTVFDPPQPNEPSRFTVAVIRLPHISNFTDFDALERHGVAVHYLVQPRDLSAYDLVVLPGTKNTRGDLSWLNLMGWCREIDQFKGNIFGICGGLQMMGQTVSDLAGVEGEPGVSNGLGLLQITTHLGGTKVTRCVRGQLDGVSLSGYEIHCGQTEFSPDSTPLFWDENGRPKGVVDGRLMGTYLHGLFDEPGMVASLLGKIRPDIEWPRVSSVHQWRAEQFDALAEHLATHLSLPDDITQGATPSRDPMGSGQSVA